MKDCNTFKIKNAKVFQIAHIFVDTGQIWKLRGNGEGLAKKSVGPSFCHIQVPIKTTPKWAKSPLNSKRLTFYRDLNICKFSADYKGYYGKKWQNLKNHNIFYSSSPVCPFLMKIGQNVAYRIRYNFSESWFFGFMVFPGAEIRKVAFL